MRFDSIYKIVIIILFCINTKTSMSQQIHIDIDFGDIIACKDNQVDVTITFPSNMSFPNHLYFGVEIDAIEVFLTPHTGTNPALIDLGTNFTAGSNVTRTYFFKIPCQNIPSSFIPGTPPQIISDNISLWDGITQLSNSNWYLTTPTGTPGQTAMNYQYSFPFFNGYISHSVPNNVDYLTISNAATFQRTVSYQNVGVAELIGEISFTDVVSCTFVQIKDIKIEFITSSGSITTILPLLSVNASSVNVPAVTCTIPPNSIITVTENLEFPDYLNNCLFDCSSDHKATFSSEFKWGCVSDLCKSITETIDLFPGPLQPNLIFQRINLPGCNGDDPWDNSNPGGPSTTWKFVLTNQGTNVDVAKDVKIYVQDRFPATSLYY